MTATVQLAGLPMTDYFKDLASPLCDKVKGYLFLKSYKRSLIRLKKEANHIHI